VIRDFEQLFEATAPDFTPFYEQLRGREAHSPSTVLSTDRVFHRGVAPSRAA
jgi:phenylalanine-4-hydroxylase